MSHKKHPARYGFFKGTIIMGKMISFIGTLLFWGFVVVKVWGTSFAAWSWWWLLFVLIPWLGLAVKHFGL